MIFDKCNKRLNFLGVFNYCSPLQILAQLNPYSLSSGIQIGQLGIGFHALYSCPNPQPPYINLYASDISMFNLALNIHNPCYPLLIAGVSSKFGSIISETYDISLSSCDLLLWHIDKPANPIVKPYSIHFTTPDPNFDIIAFNSTGKRVVKKIVSL